MKKVVCLSFEENMWKNVHLMKDCGLVPYYFHKLYGYEAVMVGANVDNYTYLDTYLDGLKMEFLNEDTNEARLKYVIDNSKDIDILMMIGPYHINLECAKTYKRINPNGKILLQLDMNSKYGEWLFYAHPELKDFNLYCDVIATSCSAVQRQMNKKLPWIVELITNGYYDGFFKGYIPDYKDKKNIILTVGRLGTWQKATEVLLEAFAKAKKEIGDWELHLVGNIEEEFKPYIKEFYDKYPECKNCVIFEGSIENKESLMDKYKEAKVFALTSRLEGGAPNVISEALRNGCVMAMTKFDAYDDIIAKGTCGLACEIDDVNGYANVLVKLCNSDKLEAMSEAAYNNAINNYNYNKSIRFLNRLLFGE